MPRTATASAASAPARRAASTRRCASVESALWSSRPDSEDVAESGNAADGEEITNKFPKLESEAGNRRDVPDSCALQAFLPGKNKTISAPAQPLVNHASQ